MAYQNTRISWDTNVKVYIRNGLHKNLSKEILKTIPSSNISRWKGEAENKYKNLDIQKLINNDIELYHELNQHPSSKKIAISYLKLVKSAHFIFDQLKDFKKIVKNNKEIIVNTIENIREYLPVKESIKLFRISRATYQNYKIQVLNKCDTSYLFWCIKKYPQQLLNKEIILIKKYFENDLYKHWSKASLYFLGLKNNDFSFGLSTFYKYSKLLGYKNWRHLQIKPKYKPLVSTKPNQIWCADVTILKTTDGVKHYIHFLIDHYSKIILGYEVANSPQPKIIKDLLQNAYENQNNIDTIDFVTDCGVENVNKTVKKYISSKGNKIVHKLAQRTIPESNSVIEAVNKVMKHQFLLPRNLQNGYELEIALKQDVHTYCYIRPQQSLRGNTPIEAHQGKPVLIPNFTTQKALRITQNQLNRCKKCSN